MKAHLCKCEKCNLTLIDQNSKVGATEYELTGKETEMQYVEDKESGLGYWVCPICETDENLVAL